MLFRAKASLTSYYFPALKLLLVTYFSDVLFFFTFAFRDWVISSASTYSLQKWLLFCISIHLQYEIEEVVERIEDSLELLLEENNGLSLKVFISTSISMLKDAWFEILVDRVIWIVKK